MKNSHLLYGVLVIVMVTGCKTKSDQSLGSKLGKIEAKAGPVRTEGRLIRTGDFPLELVSNGKLSAAKQAAVFCKKNDLITRIRVKNGMWIEKGTLMAEMDSREAELALEQATVGVGKARITLRSELIAHTGGSDSEKGIDPKALETMKMKSGFTDAELNLKRQRLDYQNCFVKAPIAGRVTRLKVKPHNIPVSGEPFCVLVNDREFDVNFNVLESELPRIKEGQPIDVYPFSMDSLCFHGAITEIDPVVDTHGMVQVKGRISNRDQILVEGMNIKVFIRFVIPGMLIIPKEALVLRNNRQVVFSVHNGRSYWNYVKTGYENSKSYTIELVTGVLKSGDTIITAGNLNLAHDADINLTFKDL
ncbi:MAG: efflux RND transporter periplasmic adaptor subunit [Bacteroidales bacterium]|nr:efflux RND transporter periplasmic adaptor subunit [Bacteroidales bacterium]